MFRGDGDQRSGIMPIRIPPVLFGCTKAATRVAERVPDELAAGSRDLRARVIEILHLEADVVQA